MRTVARQRTSRSALAAGMLAVAVAAVLGDLATAAAAQAGASTVRPAAAGPSVRSRGFAEAVSCLPSRWCMAVGRSDATSLRAVAWVWQRGTWRQLADPPGGELTGVSCSARTFCMATGRRGLSAAVLWNGSRWRVMTPAPKNARTAPSCASSHWCAVINGVGFRGSGAIAETWDGRAWKSWADTSFCNQHPSACGAVDVSCATASTCVTVGSTPALSGDAPRAAVWDGENWHISNPPGRAGGSVIPHAVSCTGTFCMTIGDAIRPKAYVALYDVTSRKWRNVSSSAGLPWPHDTCGGACFLPGTLSCASRTRCMTSGLAGFFAWNGREFRRAHPLSAGRGSRLSRVSCVRAFCMAVGYRTVRHVRAPLFEVWNGETWKVLRAS